MNPNTIVIIVVLSVVLLFAVPYAWGWCARLTVAFLSGYEAVINKLRPPNAQLESFQGAAYDVDSHKEGVGCLVFFWPIVLAYGFVYLTILFGYSAAISGFRRP